MIASGKQILSTKLAANFFGLSFLSLLFLRDAAALDLIEIEGLNLICSQCSVFPDAPCSLVIGDDIKPLSVSCEQGIGILLAKRLSENYNGTHPSAAELIRFLLSRKRPSEPAQAALELLLKSTSGVRTLLQAREQIIESYERELSTIVPFTAENKEIWTTYWVECRDKAPKIRASIFVNTDYFTLEELLSDLKGSSLEVKLQQLQLIQKLLADQGGKDRQFKNPDIVNLLVSALELCQADGFNACLDIRLDKIDPTSRRFMEEVRNELFLKSLRQNKLPPETVLGMLAKLNYSDGNATDLQKVALEQIQLSGARNFSRYLERIPDPERAMLERLAGSNKLIAAEIKLLSDRGAELPQWLKEAIEPRDEPPSAAVPILALVFATALATLLSALIKGRQHNKQNSHVWEEIKARAQREKLEEEKLREFFELDKEAGLEELTKSYYKLAKSCHPDSAGSASSQEFQRLQSRYRRAKELLSKSSTNA